MIELCNHKSVYTHKIHITNDKERGKNLLNKVFLTSFNCTLALCIQHSLARSERIQ